MSTTPTPNSTPLRQIGIWTAVSLVMGNMIGSGVFLLPASMAAYGGISLIGWLVSASGAVMLALVFAKLARLHPKAGGPYAYTRLAFGDLAAFLVGWGYWIAVWSGNAALAVAFVGYMDPFIPSIVRVPAFAATLAVATVWLFAAVNLAGVKSAGRVQVATTVLKLLPLALVGIAGLFAFAPDHFPIASTSAPAFGRSLLAAVTLTLWAFLGLESATIPAGNVISPDRTIPRATIIGTLLAALVYIISTAGVMSVLSPTALATTRAPFADAAGVLFGPAAAAAVAIGAAISCLGALNGWTLVVGQLPLAIASDGLFPKVFGQVTSAGIPARGVVISAVLTSALILTNYSRNLVDLFTFIILLATLSTLVPYVFCSLGWFLIDRDARAAGAGARLGASLVASLAFVYALFAIGGAGQDVVYWGFLLLLAGLPVYVWGARERAVRTTGARP